MAGAGCGALVRQLVPRLRRGGQKQEEKRRVGANWVQIDARLRGGTALGVSLEYGSQ